MLGNLDSISWVVKHASGLQLPGPTGFLTIVVWCRPILSSDSYYYSKEQLVETGLHRFGKGSECAVASATPALDPHSQELVRDEKSSAIRAPLFVAKISASLARHSWIPAAIRANPRVRRRVTTALRTGSDAADRPLLVLHRRTYARNSGGLGSLAASAADATLGHAANQQPHCGADGVSKFDKLGGNWFAAAGAIALSDLNRTSRIV